MEALHCTKSVFKFLQSLKLFKYNRVSGFWQTHQAWSRLIWLQIFFTDIFHDGNQAPTHLIL